MSKTLIYFISKRNICLTTPREGKRNLNKFLLPNKRGTRAHKTKQMGPNRELEIDKRGVRDVGYELNNRFYTVPEMIPELIVPDLKDFELKPYVSYRAEDVIQSEFTPQQLFNAVYSKKIVEDFKANKLDENGMSLEPSDDEKMQAEEAREKARKTGSDIF